MVGGGGRKGGAPDHADLQFFVPPYLYKGPRPMVSSAPAQITYGRPFVMQTPMQRLSQRSALCGWGQ